jgi:hypothetical protein
LPSFLPTGESVDEVAAVAESTMDCSDAVDVVDLFNSWSSWSLYENINFRSPLNRATVNGNIKHSGTMYSKAGYFIQILLIIINYKFIIKWQNLPEHV